jgi:hypothetical protein
MSTYSLKTAAYRARRPRSKLARVTRTTTSLTLALVLLGALAALGGCRSDPSVAAYVGDEHITISTLDDQVDEAEQDPYWGEAVRSERATATRHTLNILVMRELLRQGATDLGVSLPTHLVAEKREALEREPSQRAPLLQGVPLALAAENDAYIELVGQGILGDATATGEINARWQRYLEELAERHPIEVNPRYGTLKTGTLLLVATPQEGVKA